jgi:hypothetical protein
MNTSKAKRRLIRWMRYLDHTNSISTNKARGGYHLGHVNAYHDVSFAGLGAARGIRCPWVRTARIPREGA